MVSVGGEPSGRTRETATKSIGSAPIVNAKDKCTLEMKLTGILEIIYYRDWNIIFIIGIKCYLDCYATIQLNSKYFNIGLNPLDLEATLTSPDGESEACEIRDKADFLFEIRFSPPQAGTHTLSIKYKGIHLPGNM